MILIRKGAREKSKTTLNGNIELFFFHFQTCKMHGIEDTRIYHSSSKKWKPRLRWCTMQKNHMVSRRKSKNGNSLKILPCASDRPSGWMSVYKEPQRLKTDLAVLCNCSALNGFALRFQSTKRMKRNRIGGKNVLSTCHWNFNSFFSRSIAIFWIVFPISVRERESKCVCIENGQSSSKY